VLKNCDVGVRDDARGRDELARKFCSVRKLVS